MRILVAEGDAALADLLQKRLLQEQFAVHVVADGKQAERLAADEAYDLVLLDLDLPGAGGLEMVRQIRSRKPDLPVVIVSGATPVEERVRRLDAGADDCVTKPFAFAELAARIRAVLRRVSRERKAVLEVDDLVLDRFSHTVQRGGEEIELSPKEFALLEFLMRNAGQAVARDTIMKQVWKLDFESATNIVDVYINYLRRKIDNRRGPHLIRTVRRVGYQIGGNGAGTQSTE
jgi:DNA-binding response OmpR family regulator